MSEPSLEEKERIILGRVKRARDICHKICDIEVSGEYSNIEMAVGLVSMLTILERESPGITESANIILEGARELSCMPKTQSGMGVS